VVKSKFSIIVLTHCHSAIDGTWNPLGDGHFLSLSVVQICHSPIEIHSQAVSFSWTTSVSTDISLLVISIQSQAVYVGAEIVILPLHNKLSLLIVLIFVPLTNVGCTVTAPVLPFTLSTPVLVIMFVHTCPLH